MSFQGHIDHIARSGVSGWAYDDQNPRDRVLVSIFVDGVRRGVCLADESRPGFVPPMNDADGTNYVFHFVFDPPLSPFAARRVEVKETWSGDLLPNGQCLLPRPEPGPGEPGAVPILLTSTGRSGTTMLMSEFARHPDIVVGDRYPYEVKQIAYHAAAFRALVADADRVRATDPDVMLAREACQRIGGNPYNVTGMFDLGTTGAHLREFWHRGMPSAYARLYRSLIRDFYTTLASGQGKRAARYFCEKGDADEVVIEGARLFLGAVKQIVMLRDPRDLLCSAIAFWKLSAEDAIVMLRTTWPKLVRAAREADPATIVVRYEDLIRDPIFVRRAIFDFLELEFPGVRPADDDAIASSHRTTPNAAASIGRWRNDLTQEQIAACEAAFADGMRTFDYAFAASSNGTSTTGPSGTRRPAPALVAAPVAPVTTIVAAEGPARVAEALDQGEPPNAAGCLAETVMDLSFNARGNGGSFMGDGWSTREADFVWSCAPESHLRLPAANQDRARRLRVVLAPFTSDPAVPSQRVSVSLNGREVGAARVREICVLSIDLPSSAAGTLGIDGSDKPIALTFRFPDATRPCDVGGNGDNRSLGCALSRLTMFQYEAEPSEARIRYVGAPLPPSTALAPSWQRGAAE